MEKQFSVICTHIICTQRNNFKMMFKISFDRDAKTLKCGLKVKLVSMKMKILHGTN